MGGTGLAPGGLVGAGARPTEGGEVGRQQLSPQQVAQIRAHNQAMARRAMRQQVPASGAFDLVRRNQPTKPAAPPADFGNVGRNDPCPCGSGKKFKKCHGAS